MAVPLERRPDKIPPSHPLSRVELQTFGNVGRCKYTGWPLECGSGAWPPALQMVANRLFLEQGIKITKTQAAALAAKPEAPKSKSKPKP